MGTRNNTPRQAYRAFMSKIWIRHHVKGFPWTMHAEMEAWPYSRLKPEPIWSWALISGRLALRMRYQIHIKEEVQDNTYSLQADAENMKLPDSCIDAIICSGMLHYLYLPYALPGLRRILKPNGRILAVEAREYNPIIKVSRHDTTMMRTDSEKNHILGLSDIRFAKRNFALGDIRF